MSPTESSLLSTLWSRQINRYRQKGLANSLIAMTLLFVIIHGSTALGRQLWPIHIANPSLFTIVAKLLIHVLFQLLYFAMFLPGYLGNESYTRYEITPQAVRPWQRENWPQMKWRIVWFLFWNKAVVFPVMVYLSLSMGGTRTRFQDFPSSWEVFKQLVIVMWVEDFFFYWGHKLSHEIPFLYKYHKVHHENEELFSLAAEYTHPVDYVISILIPSAIPFILLGSQAHCFMLLFWQVWKIFISSEGHCGFEFPFSLTRILPLVSGAGFHDFHHTMNAGNFSGSIYFWDTVVGTSDEYWGMVEKKSKVKQNAKQNEQQQ